MNHSKGYKKIHKHRLYLIETGRVNIINGRKKRLTWEEFTRAQIGCNKCATLFNMQEGRFTKWHYINELLGYTDEEFNHEALNNIGKIKIVHPDDYEHIHRYDTIIYSLLLGTPNIFGILSDNYILNFRIKDKVGKIHSVRRTSYVFDVDEKNRPLHQLDTWEINNRYSANRTFPDLILASQKLSENLTTQFYKENLKEIGLAFSISALKVLHYKIQGYSNQHIAEKLKMNEQVVANTHNKNFNKLRNKQKFKKEIDKIINQKAGDGIGRNIKVFEEICKRYGIYPVPYTLLTAKKGIR